VPEFDLETALGWRGRTLLDYRREKVGTIGELYIDASCDRLAYAGVRTGLLGRREAIVPLQGIVERDGELVAPHDADLIFDAPAIAPDEALDELEARRLRHHYGAAATSTPAERLHGDGEMIRSEEEVVTGTTPMRPAERVRLRKVLVTDYVKKTMPIRREEIRLETEPPPEGGQRVR
jgi:hypothetical protein